MEQFKGTKEKWRVDFFEGTVISEQGKLICDVMPTSLEDKANALLISKAPEMLELLKDIYFGSDGYDINYWKDKIEQLIKEATEI